MSCTYASDKERSDGVRRQLNDVDESHVHHSVVLSSTVWPVLIALDLSTSIRNRIAYTSEDNYDVDA